MSVALRLPVPGDAAWLETWLLPVAASVGHDAVGLSSSLRRSGAMRARIIIRDGVDAGLLAYRVDAPARGSALFEIVATPLEQARRGSGMAAAMLAEQELRTAGARIVYAPAPAVHGIGLYFWLRLGYRPLLRPEWPCERAGVAWLSRRI